MSGPNDQLTLDFLEWLTPHPRSYVEAMDAWRTSCPRLTVWEDALQAGLIRVSPTGPQGQSMVSVTQQGALLLQQHRS